MENKKLEELENMLNEAKEVIIKKELGIIDYSKRFDFKIIKKKLHQKHVIEFNNINHAVETFSILVNNEIAKEIELKLINQAAELNINKNKPILIELILSGL
jgi:hypothetical protein